MKYIHLGVTAPHQPRDYIMLKNSVIKTASHKVAGTSLLSGSLLLVGGVVIWHLWRKQAQLSIETDELSNQLEDIKDQLAEMKTEGESESEVSFSSSLKKLASFNPWASGK